MTWIKACGSGTCIEVSASVASDTVLIRCLPTSPDKAIRATYEEWWQFLDGVKAGAFDDVIPRPQP